MSNNRPRVFMIGWELPPQNSGGLGVACDGLTKALAGDGYQITFTLPYAYDGQADYMKIVDCYDDNLLNIKNGKNSRPPFDVYQSFDRRLTGQKLPFSVLPDDLPSSYQESILDGLGSGIKNNLKQDFPLPYSTLEKEVNHYMSLVLEAAEKKKRQIDVIHAHDWMSFPAAIKVKQELKKPMVVHVHSTEYDRSLNADFNSYIPRVELEGMRLADKIITVSYYTKRLLVEKYFINPDKIEVVHNGILPKIERANPLNANFASGRPVVVFMGRLTIQKGPDYFLRLAEEILRERPDALFVVAGNGDLYQDMMFRNAHSGMSASVLFTNFLRGAQREALLDRADVFVMPSVSEPFGLVALEAVQRGTPVVISRYSGVAEVLTDTPTFDFWDIKKLAAETLHLISEKKYHDEVLRRQSAKMEKLDWKQAAHKVEKVYQSLV